MEEKSEIATSGVAIAYRLKQAEFAELMKWLQDGNSIGKTVTLTVTDNYNRFDLGTVTARIEAWNPAPPRSVRILGIDR